jgi:hypothetical protein
MSSFIFHRSAIGAAVFTSLLAIVTFARQTEVVEAKRDATTDVAATL